VRPAGDPDVTDAVLVARTYGVAPPPRLLRRRSKPRPADPEAGVVVPLTELTVIYANEIDGEGEAWLKAIRNDEDRRDELVARALAHVTRALAARRVATADPGIPDATLDGAVGARIGYGDGDALVEGRYEAALELPREGGRRSRAAALRPQERMAAVLGGRDRALACEELVLRARADLDAVRVREAALQIRVGLEALLAERGNLNAPGQDEDLAFLDERKRVTGEAANEALRGELSSERRDEVAETLAVCERVLRRQTVHGWR
jgi:hypothetical protein